MKSQAGLVERLITDWLEASLLPAADHRYTYGQNAANAQ